MEEGIDGWKQRHHFSVLSTPRAVQALYSTLFAKVESASHLLVENPSPVPRLMNPSGTNCFFNVTLQTLFSNDELARSVVFSKKQSPALKLAFLRFREMLLTDSKTPIDLASSLRLLYKEMEKPGQHDAVELMTLMMKDSENDALSTLRTITQFKDFERHLDQLTHFEANGTRIQETREAVYTLPLAGKKDQTLETLLWHSFNETVTDTTPIELDSTDGKISLSRTSVQTRYLSAPKFLIFNLGRASFNQKENASIGLQQIFYLTQDLTLDKKGAKYSLQSFNVHVGNNTNEGHYIHYRQRGEKYFCYSDAEVEEISSIEYLLAAQKAYVIVLQRKEYASPEEIYLGMSDNHNRFNSMRFISNVCCALKGHPDDDAIIKPSRPPLSLTLLENFIQNLLAQQSLEEAFAKLDGDLQILLLKLWSKTGSLHDMFETIEEQTKDPQLPREPILKGYFFSYGKQLMAMMDLLAIHVINHPEETAIGPETPETALIAAIASISEKTQISILRKQVAAHETLHIALASLVSFRSLKGTSQKVSFKALIEHPEVFIQSVSSLVGFTRAYLDPRSKNKTLGLLQQWITPTISSLYTKNPKPLLSPTISFLLDKCSLSPKVQTVTSSLISFCLADVAVPSLKEAWSNTPTKDLKLFTRFGSSCITHLTPRSFDGLNQRISMVFGLITQLLRLTLQGTSNPLHFQSLSEALRSELVQISLTNASLQSLFSDVTATYISEKYYTPPLREAFNKKAAELDQALEEGNQETIKILTEEIKKIGKERKAFREQFEPSTIDDYIVQKRHYLSQKQKETEFKQTCSILEKAIEGANPEAIQAAANDVQARASELQELGVELPPEIEEWLESVKQIQEVSFFNHTVDKYNQAIEANDDTRAEQFFQELSDRKEKLEKLGISFSKDLLVSKKQPHSQEVTQPIVHPERSIPPIQPQTIPLSCSMRTHKKEYFVDLKNNDQNTQKQIGKFSNKESAQFFQREYENYIKKLNNQNQEIAQTKIYYYKQGMDPADVETLQFSEPIYIEISACGSESKVYRGDQKVLTTKSRDKAISKALKMMAEHITRNDQTIHNYKTNMADKIFIDPTISPFIKEQEVQRITTEQQQDMQTREEALQKQKELNEDHTAAHKKKTHKAKEERKALRYESDRHGIHAEALQEKIEDNNFTLQIAQGNTTREESNQVKKEFKDAKRRMPYVNYNLEDKTETFQKTKKDKDYKKAKKATEIYNQSKKTLTQATNRYYEVQGVDYKMDSSPALAAPTKATTWEKLKAWTKNNVSVSGEVNVVTVSCPGAPPQPTLIHIQVDPPTRKTTTYEEGQHQVELAKKDLHAATTKPATESNLNIPNPFIPQYVPPLIPSIHPNILETINNQSPHSLPPIPTEGGYFSNIYDAHIAQSLIEKRSIKSHPTREQLTQPYTTSQRSSDNALSSFNLPSQLDTSFEQPLPKSTPVNSGESQTRINPLSNIKNSRGEQLFSTDYEYDNTPDISKPSLMKLFFKNFLNPDRPHSPEERIEQNTIILTAHIKALAKSFGAMADELKNFGKLNVTVEKGKKAVVVLDHTVSNQINQWIEQHLPDMSYIPNFDSIEFIAGVGNDLIITAFMTPAFTGSKRLVNVKEIPALKKVNNPAYRGGIVSDKTIAKLTKKELKALQTIENATLQVEKKAILKTNSSLIKTLESVQGISAKDIQRLEQEISSWLGKDTKLIRNKAGDSIFLSKDGIRKVRFDFNRPYPHENPHLHFERLENGCWEEIKRIYPSDLPHK
jgi:hypothetical protein